MKRIETLNKEKISKIGYSRNGELVAFDVGAWIEGNEAEVWMWVNAHALTHYREDISQLLSFFRKGLEYLNTVEVWERGHFEQAFGQHFKLSVKSADTGSAIMFGLAQYEEMRMCPYLQGFLSSSRIGIPNEYQFTR